MPIARRAGAGMRGDRLIGCLERVDETQRDVSPSFADVVVDGGFDILARQRTREDRLSAHPALAYRTRSLRPPK